MFSCRLEKTKWSVNKSIKNVWFLPSFITKINDKQSIIFTSASNLCLQKFLCSARCLALLLPYFYWTFSCECRLQFVNLVSAGKFVCKYMSHNVWKWTLHSAQKKHSKLEVIFMYSIGNNHLGGLENMTPLLYQGGQAQRGTTAPLRATEILAFSGWHMLTPQD